MSELKDLSVDLSPAYTVTEPKRPELSEIPGVMAERWGRYDRQMFIWTLYNLTS